ncbi:hypothetical protein M3Y99_00681300 [Aphelenchoides fujianensis]|nr:hypothetical protein M3Y99_00681300 [Aphelenchoides fujianensis]
MPPASTGPQSLTIDLGDFVVDDNLQLNAGVFLSDNSQTFVQTGVFNDSEFGEPLGVYGMDNFLIGDGGVSFKQKPFALLDADNSGVVSLGAQPVGRCGQEWKFAPEATVTSSYQQWSMDATELSFGIYQYDSPGRVFLSLTEPYTGLPRKIFEAFLKTLGSFDPQDIPCDANATITLTIGEVELHLTPDDYLDPTSEKYSGKCALYMYEIAAQEFYLPTTLWTRHCLQLDYANAQVGFADRLQQ